MVAKAVRMTELREKVQMRLQRGEGLPESSQCELGARSAVQPACAPVKPAVRGAEAIGVGVPSFGAHGTPGRSWPRGRWPAPPARRPEQSSASIRQLGHGQRQGEGKGQAGIDGVTLSIVKRAHVPTRAVASPRDEPEAAHSGMSLLCRQAAERAQCAGSSALRGSISC